MNHLAKITLLAPCVLAATACERPTRQPPPPPAVIVANPQVRDVTSTTVLIGRTEAAEFVEVRARITGFLEELGDFEPGSFVDAGDLLFTIVPDEFESRVSQAAASVTIAEAELARAEADLARVKQAVETNAVSKSEVGLRRADRDKAAGSVEAASAQLREAQLDLSYTKITSPIAGRLSRNYVTQGNLVGAGGEATLLTTVASMQPIFAYFDVPERYVVRHVRKYSARELSEQEKKKEMPVRVALEGDEGFPHAGYIDFIDNQVDPTTGTIEVRASLPNEDLKVIPGLFARIQIPGEVMKDSLVVEETAIGTDLGGKFVLVVGGDNIVERRYVTLGDAADGMRPVLDGLEPDVNYIVEGMIRARPGLPVRPMTREEAAAARQDAGAGTQKR